jgi:hypothetical protein
MTPDQPNSPLERLDPAVAGYQTEKFRLRCDLDHLGKVHQVGAPEAAILYCARILDALAAAALKAVRLEPSANVFSNLGTLQQYNLMPTATRYWAHALRRAGNQARHIHRNVRPGDAELAVLFAERWLEWFFRTFPYGHRLPSLTRDGQPLGLCARASLRVLLEALEGLDPDYLAILRDSETQPGELLWTPTLPALLGEMLLDRGHYPDAFTVLDGAGKEFPEDLRLRQLLGLYWSRTGNLEKARECLEPLYDQYKDDDETAGITAGVYKRLWLKDRANWEWLERSQRIYRQGWKRSRQSNTYLGINAATTALLLGRVAEARQIAGDIRRLLSSRAALLAGQGGGPHVLFSYWDQITLAEAELVLGELAIARRMYRAAFAQHAGHHDASITVSQNQLGEILRALGLSCTWESFLDRRRKKGQPP